MIKPFLIAFITTAATLLITDSASAQTASSDATRLRGDIHTGIAAIPDVAVADHHRLILPANGQVGLNQRHSEIEGVAARANLLSLDAIERGFVTNRSFSRDRTIAGAAVRQQGDSNQRLASIGLLF